MQVFDENHIRNIVLVGGAHSGKTTLAETMMYESKLISRRGTVESKNTVSDFHEIEQERGTSVYATPLHTEWRNYKINIIDTPGLDDFIGEIIASLRVADTAVMLINAQHGVEVGTELIWNHVDRYRKPVIFAINQLDHAKADFEGTYKSIRDHFGTNAVLMQYPVNAGEGFNAIIDLLKMVMYRFPAEGGKPEKLPIPDSEKQTADELHNLLVEKAAENDESLMNLYFEKGTLNEDELRKGLHIGMLNHEVFPVFCVSALKNMGSGRLMGFIDNVAPAAHELKPEITEEGNEVKNIATGPAVVFVFRTEFEPNLGKLSFFKVLSGELKKGTQLKNSNTHVLETFNQLFVMDGHTRSMVDVLKAGDIGATLKLKNTETNHTLHALEGELKVQPIDFPRPRMTVSIVANNKKDDERLGEVLRKIHEQDPTIEYEQSRELKQLLLHCQGELHLATTRWTLEKVYGMDVKFEKPRIAYRETITRAANATYRHKKQSGGAGQFAEVHIKIEPYYDGMPEPSGFNVRDKQEIELDWGGKLVFYNCIVGGAIDTRFIPSVLKGIMHKMEQGPLTGSYVRDVRVMLYDGKMHDVDSNDISFQIAAQMAFKEAFVNAQPKLLEPIFEIEITSPNEVTGDVMTDLQGRRAIILGMDAVGRYTKITAKVPASNLYKYTTSLRSVSQGKASFSGRFSEYAPVPPNVQEEVIAEHKHLTEIES
ncbi:MAG: elongation factor G [Flavobacteriales bacterium]|nr:elongation factor G [Flavobacteriales bacterium]